MKTNFEPRSREIKGGLSVGGGENLSTCLLQQKGGGGEGGKFGWIEFDKRVDSLTQVPSGFGYGVAVLEIGLSRQRLGGGGEGESSGDGVFGDYRVYELSIVYRIRAWIMGTIYTDTRILLLSFRYFF